MQLIKSLQDHKQSDMSKRHAPTDKKMRLIQAIRAENMDNRIKIRQREDFLYGNGGGNNMLPLFGKADSRHLYMDELYRETENPDEITPVSNTFRLRMITAVILFVAFLMCDAGGYKIWGCSTNDIYGMITEDYFHIYNNKSADELPQLTEVLKFK